MFNSRKEVNSQHQWCTPGPGPCQCLDTSCSCKLSGLPDAAAIRVAASVAVWQRLTSLPSMHRFATTLLTLHLAGALAIKSLEPKEANSLKEFFSTIFSPTFDPFSNFG